MRKPVYRKYSLFAVGTLLLVILDQLSKIAAEQFLRPHAVIVFPGVLELRYLQNRGAAFGILQNRQWVFILFALAVTAGAGFLYPKIKPDRHFHLLRMICILLSAGAAGNMLDRIFRGYVVDFIYFSLIDFPVFNIADIYVTAGCLLLLLGILTLYRNDEEILDHGQ